MMTYLALGVGGVALIAVIGFVLLVWRGFAQNWRPEELKRGRVVMVEKDLYLDGAFPLAGRPDQVYRLPNGLHVPVENKNRDFHRVYETDVAELSLQAWMLRRLGMPTAAHGYVAANNRKTGERKALKVQLGDDQYCERLIRRYQDLIEGRVEARRSRGKKCDNCGHRRRC